MKKFKKAITILSALVMGVTAFAACGGNSQSGENKGDPNEIMIYYWNSGYGKEFMEKIVADFNASQTQYRADLTLESNAGTIIKSLESGNGNPYDLYFTMLNTSKYNDSFINLDDVLDSKADGESVTIREKYYDYLLNGVKEADGKTRFLTYGNGWCSLIYNADIIDGVKYAVPNTTDELETLVASITEVKPWIFYNDSNNNGYWNYAAYAWEAQYDGIDYYYNTTMQLKAEDGTSPSKEVFTRKDGRFKALEVIESILSANFVHPDSTKDDFTASQVKFLNGEAAMTINGSWLMKESKGTKENFVMMKMPVISKIVEKLEDKTMTDETLSAIVAEVDEGKTSSELCSDKDFKKIKEARNLMYNNASEQYVFIPEYSSSKEGAKAFLKYFYSDKGTSEFMKATNLPASVRLADASLFDASNLNAWFKVQHNLSKEVTAITNTMVKSPVYINSSVNHFANLTFAQSFIKDDGTNKTAEELWNNDVIGFIEENWDDWSRNV